MRGLSLLILLGIWWLVSVLLPPKTFPTPVDTGRKLLFDVFLNGAFFEHSYVTILRVFAGFAFALVVGLGVGIAMGVSRSFERLLEMEVLIGLTIPGLMWAVVSLILFGINEAAVVFSIFIISCPFIALNFWEGTKSLDRKLIEMAKVFEASRGMIVRDIFLPQLMPYILASTRIGLSFAWKIVVVIELLGMNKGVGYMVHFSYQLFDLAGVLAWTMAFTLVMLLIEYGLIKHVERRYLSWRPSVML